MLQWNGRSSFSSWINLVKTEVDHLCFGQFLEESMNKPQIGLCGKRYFP